MNTAFFILTVLFIIAATAMILIILVQRPSGGGLAGAFGGAGGSSSDTIFGGRVGDALTTMTVIAFLLYMALAIALNKVDSNPVAEATPVEESTVTTAPDITPTVAVTDPATGATETVPVQINPPPQTGIAERGTIPGRVAPEDFEAIQEALKAAQEAAAGDSKGDGGGADPNGNDG